MVMKPKGDTLGELARFHGFGDCPFGVIGSEPNITLGVLGG